MPASEIANDDVTIIKGLGEYKKRWTAHMHMGYTCGVILQRKIRDCLQSKFSMKEIVLFHAL